MKLMATINRNVCIPFTVFSRFNQHYCSKKISQIYTRATLKIAK